MKLMGFICNHLHSNPNDIKAELFLSGRQLTYKHKNVSFLDQFCMLWFYSWNKIQNSSTRVIAIHFKIRKNNAKMKIQTFEVTYEHVGVQIFQKIWGGS